MKALVLSGGGSKGSFQLGVLRALLDKTPELSYDIFSGISVGALNSALLASGSLRDTLSILENIWLKDIKGNRSIWKHYLFWYLLISISLIVFFVITVFITFILETPKAFTIGLAILAICSFYIPVYFLKNLRSVYKTDPLRKIVEKYLDMEKLKNSGKQLRIGVVCYETGEYKTISEQNDNIIDWIMASAAFPVFFPMLKIGDKYWLDGGIINICDIKTAISLGATEIDIILTTPLDQSVVKEAGLLNEFERTMDLMSLEILNNDITTYKGNINIRVFMPTKNFNVSSLNFDPKIIKKLYEAGKQIVNPNLNI